MYIKLIFAGLTFSLTLVIESFAAEEQLETNQQTINFSTTQEQKESLEQRDKFTTAHCSDGSYTVSGIGISPYKCTFTPTYTIIGSSAINSSGGIIGVEDSMFWNTSRIHIAIDYLPNIQSYKAGPIRGNDNIGHWADWQYHPYTYWDNY